MAKRLTLYILIGMIVGIALGCALNLTIGDPARLKAIGGYFGIVTTIFLRLIKMIIAPLVFSTLVVGIAHMGDTAALGRIGARTMGWFVSASLVSLVLGLLLFHALDGFVGLAWPGSGFGLSLPPPDAAPGIDESAFSFANFVTHIVPSSIFERWRATRSSRSSSSRSSREWR